jgi:hypothetical protein
MDPNIGKATIGKERTAAPCKESLPTSRGPHRNRFLEVQAEIRARMTSDKKTLLVEANASAKRNLISVGGCADTSVHVDAAGNADGKRPCLGNGQTEEHGWGVLSEGHGWGRQEGYLVSDAGFFQGSGGQGFEQDEGTV